MLRSFSVSRPNRFARAESGVATIEFAVLVPILLTLVYGVAEYVNIADNRNKVSALARTLADLTSQNSTKQIEDKYMENIRASRGPILAPFNASLAQVQISAIGVNDGNSAFVCSTWPTANATRNVGKDATLEIPKNFQRAGARYILAEVRMDYQPLFSTILHKLIKPLDLDFKWYETVAWPIRGGQKLDIGLDPEVVLPGGKECNPKAT